MKDNPYNSTVSKRHFYGRELEIQEIENHLKKNYSPYIRGGIASGKTSLLLQLMNRWNEGGSKSAARLAVWIELRELRIFCGSSLELIYSMLSELKNAVARRALEKGKTWDAKEPARNIDDFRTFRDNLLKFASEQLGIQEIALLLDETEVLGRLSWRNDFLAALNPLIGPARAMHSSFLLPRVGLVFAGHLKMNEIEEPDVRNTSPFGNYVRTIPLKVLPDERALELIGGLSSEVGLRLSGDTISTIFKMTGGHPALIHEVMRALGDRWEDTGKRVGKTDINNIAQELSESVPLFTEYNARLTGVQRKAIHLLWDAQAPRRFEDLQQRFEYLYGDRFTRTDLEDLLCTGLCCEVPKGIDLVGEMFRQWWTNHWRLERPNAAIDLETHHK